MSRKKDLKEDPISEIDHKHNNLVMHKNYTTANLLSL